MRRISGFVVVFFSFCACEALGEAYGCGYDAGYGFADCVLDEGERRGASVDAWRDACASHDPISAEAQQAGDDACQERNSFSSRLIACDDPGPERDVLPPGCSAAGDDNTFACPDGVEGECLCCDEPLEDCGLAGDFCSDNADCCSGVCLVESVDGGPATSGSCQ